jgi:hypothetical protein
LIFFCQASAARANPTTAPAVAGAPTAAGMPPLPDLSQIPELSNLGMKDTTNFNIHLSRTRSRLLAGVFNNPQFMTMAQQMMQNPAFMEM